MELIRLIQGLIDSKNKWIQSENKRAMQNCDKEEFTLYCARSYRIWAILCLTLLSLLVTAVLLVENAGTIPWLIAGALFLAALLHIVSCFHWRMTCDRFFIEYQPRFGIVRRFQYDEVRHIRLKNNSYVLQTDDVSIVIDKKIIGYDLLLEKLKRLYSGPKKEL